jgi:hypothetical protein
MCTASVLCSYTNNKRRCRRILKFVTSKNQHRINYVADKQNPLLKKRRWHFSHSLSATCLSFPDLRSARKKASEKERDVCVRALAIAEMSKYLSRAVHAERERELRGDGGRVCSPGDSWLGVD